jgi:hypothetical protein
MAVKTYDPRYNYGTGASRFYHGDKSPGHMKGVDSVGRGYDYSKSALAARPGSAPVKTISRNEWTPAQEKIFKDILGTKPSSARAKASTSAADVIKQKTKELTRELARKAPKGSTIHATGYDSSCFESLDWKADKDGDGTVGTVTATFWRGGDLVYQYDDIDIDFFADWASSSWGGVFNAEVR